MKKIAIAALVLSVVIPCASSWSADAPLVVVQPVAAPAAELAVLKTFPVGGESRWDYVTVDAEARRVYVAQSTRVAVFDADKGTLVGEVPDTAGVHGVAIVSEKNLGFATCGKDSSIVVFDLKTLKPTGKIPAGQRPDAILYDPASKKVFAFDHATGDVIIVDPFAQDKLGDDNAVKPNTPTTLAVGGTLEFAVTDGVGHVYVNVEDKNELVVIDSKAMKITARYSIAPGESPTGLAIDTAHRRLFVGCSNQKLIVLDADTGKVLADVPVGQGVDGVAYDAQSGLVLVPNGRGGTLTVVKDTATGSFQVNMTATGGKGQTTLIQGGQPKYEVVQTLKTVKGARTIAIDPKTHCAWLPCMVPAANGKETFGVIVVGPAPKK